MSEYNKFYDIDDLDLPEEKKKDVLEYLARKLWILIEESSGDPDYYGKSYDPLVIDLEKKEAYSYVFNLETGGRIHPFLSLQELEKTMMNETIMELKSRRVYG